jgi:hypothetical protein
MRLSLNKKGAETYKKVSYPIRYGRFSEIEDRSYIYQFNPNGEIRFIQGKNGSWPHPAEWLKRTPGNDWVYYFSGGYTNVADCLGEYYVPCLPYASNSLWTTDPFSDPQVLAGLEAWKELRSRVAGWRQAADLPGEAADFLDAVRQNGPHVLWKRALELFAILGGRVSVLPPDARHVDYDCIPVMIADGCLYNCGFCSVKSNTDFAPRSRSDIQRQVRDLRSLYGRELANQASVFLGLHDGLACSPDLIEFGAREAWSGLQLERSNLKDHGLFLFGSVDSLLKAPESLWRRLGSLPFHTWINIGLESGDQATLDQLRKPITRAQVQDAFERLLEINRSYQDIEVTANFVMGPGLPQSHWESVGELIAERLDRFTAKGAVYFSPLERTRAKEQLRFFQRIKRMSRLPAYLYLIQRL